MKYLFTLIILFATFHVCFAQEFSFEDYDFDDNKIEIPAEYSDKSELIVFLHRKVELRSTEKSVDQYYLHHEKLWVNSDDAIEKNNRIYINYDNEDQFIINKNRVILTDGKVIELDKSDIHEETDPESGRNYKYYAVKGLEKGAFIEKLYIRKEAPVLNGTRFNFQFGTPLLDASFQLIYPKHLIFKHKSYNGLAEAIVNDSLITDMNLIEVNAQNINAVNFDEKMANPTVHVKGFRYKLFENLISGTRNFYNYNEFGGKFYTNINSNVEKKHLKKLKKFFSKIRKTGNKKNDLLAIEHLIKTNIAYNASFNENENIGDVLKSKQASLYWLLKLYKESLDLYDMSAEMVLTTNRFEKEFDLEFETTSNLDEALIYIPEIDQYLDPNNLALRSPLFNYSLGNHHGLKISELEFGGSKMPVSETIFIPLPSMEVTSDTMSIDVDFSREIDNPYVKSNIVFGGYAGANMQPIKDFVAPDQYDEVLLDICRNYSADVTLEKYKAVNDGIDLMGKKAFGLEIEFYGEDLIQNAGDKLLFQLGRLIGKQSEIYQVEERIFPVESTYPHHYTRSISIKLPDGYKISNPEVLNLDYITVMDGVTEAKFISSYKLDGNNLTVYNTEFYKRIDFPLSYFESYQSVINAAADFNKIVLILEKI